MTLNPDCIRDILLNMEDISLSESLYFNDLCNLLPQYSHDEIKYCCLQMKESGFIKATISAYDNQLHLLSLDDITYQGHDFLNMIRSESKWKHIKKALVSIGKITLPTLLQVASKIVLG